MVFSNAIFLFFFLPIVLLLYYCPLWKKNITFKNLLLLLASLLFYSWGEPVYVFLMILSIVVNYFFGLWVSGCPKTKKGKQIVAAACVYNLGQLFVFKYLSWIIGMANPGYNGLFSGLVLPIGISFYTFQALSYVIDVYRGRDQAQKNVMNVGLYIAFFPQLIAGPIVRYGSIAKQLREREHSLDLFSEGVWRFCIGLSKKVLIANEVAHLADLSFGMAGPQLPTVLAWAGALAFMLQIYFDFSGYSDMAIGLGKMFGFQFNENFNYPYVSKSITEYWRRWHISLGEWFRDYLYYPLSLGPAIRLRKRVMPKFGRKQSAVISTCFVLFVTWMATGIWHGANWTFVLWGFIQFVFLFWEQYRKPMKNKKLGAVIGFITTFFVILITKVIFKADSLTQAFHYYGSMLHLNGNLFCGEQAAYWLWEYKNVLLIGLLFAFPVVEKINELVKDKVLVCRVWDVVKTLSLLAMLIFDAAYAVGGGYNPFIYFNF